jgi:hypothetical protein
MTPESAQTGSDDAAALQGRFSTETIEVVTQIRDACARIIETKCPDSKAVTAVSDAFGIHRKLAWQVVKVAYADDPFVASRHMPPSKSARLWLKSAEKAGVSRALVDSARVAFDSFEDVIRTHASSRAEFEMLIESIDDASDTNVEEKWRQHSFLGNSYTLGVQCRVLMSLLVQMPSRDREGYFDAVQVRGVMGYRQTRQDVRWVVNQSVVLDDDNKDEFAMTRHPLDPHAAERYNGVPLLPEFCSDPIPALQRVPAEQGMVQDELLSGEVGLLGQRTLVTGELLRNIAPVHATSESKKAHFGVAVRVPCEMLHYDLFVHKGLFGEVTRELEVFNELATQITFDQRDEIRVSDQVKHLGMGVSLAQAPDIAGYTDLARSIFERIEADPDDFELYRIRMAYPPIPTSVLMRHELLPKG